MTTPTCNCLADLVLVEASHEPWCQTLGGWECPHCDEPRFPDEQVCPECHLPRSAADAYQDALDEWLTCQMCKLAHPSVDLFYDGRCDACARRICNTDAYELHWQERGKLLAKVLIKHAAGNHACGLQEERLRNA